MLLSYQREDELLSDQVAKFWDLDTVGIVENEMSVYEKLIDKVKFDEEQKRYQIRLPFKVENPVIAAHYDLCLNRLMNLKRNLIMIRSTAIATMTSYRNRSRRELSRKSSPNLSPAKCAIYFISV